MKTALLLVALLLCPALSAIATDAPTPAFNANAELDSALQKARLEKATAEISLIRTRRKLYGDQILSNWHQAGESRESRRAKAIAFQEVKKIRQPVSIDELLKMEKELVEKLKTANANIETLERTLADRAAGKAAIAATGKMARRPLQQLLPPWKVLMMVGLVAPIAAELKNVSSDREAKAGADLGDSPAAHKASSSAATAE